jgi:hypothetical protein
MDDEQINKLFHSLNSGMSAFNAQLDKNNELLFSLISRQKERDKKEEKFLFKEVVVLANNDKESAVVNNPGFNRARIFLDAGFTPAHTGGLSVSLLYKNSIMSDVLTLISSNGSCGKASEPVDIANLSGFYFLIKNHDTSNDTSVRNFRVVLYNEARA